MKVRKYTADESVLRNLFPGGEVQFVHTDNMSFASWSFEAGTRVPAHAHPHEQITHCVAGSLLFEISGEEIMLRAGDTLVIPGGVEHKARVDEATRGVDVCYPVREDYKSMAGEAE